MYLDRGKTVWCAGRIYRVVDPNTPLGVALELVGERTSMRRFARPEQLREAERVNGKWPVGGVVEYQG